MRPRFSLILTLFAWLLATGSHWDLVQTYAWGSMIADYTQRMPFAAAVKKTFSAETMCEICHVVADAKKSSANEAAAPGPKSTGKIFLVTAPAGSVVFKPAAACTGLVPSIVPPSSVERASPPSPPPRALV